MLPDEHLKSVQSAGFFETIRARDIAKHQSQIIRSTTLELRRRYAMLCNMARKKASSPPHPVPEFRDQEITGAPSNSSPAPPDHQVDTANMPEEQYDNKMQADDENKIGADDENKMRADERIKQEVVSQAQAEALQAAATAMRAAEEAAASFKAAADVPQVKLPSLESFNKFNKKSGGHERTSSKGPSSKRHKSKHSKEGRSDGLSSSGTESHKNGAAPSEAAAVGGGGGGGGADAIQSTVSAYIKKQLQEMLHTGKLSMETGKRITEKATAKVMESCVGKHGPPEKFLNADRKAKIKKLVAAYAKKR